MTKLERNIVFSLPLISICFEIVKSFMSGENNIMALRNYSFFLIIIFLVIKYFKVAVEANIYLVLLMFYLILLLVLTQAKLEQVNDFIRVMDGKLTILLGFILTSTYGHVQTINKRLFVTNILFVVSIIVFSILGIGQNQYGADSGFNVGYFNHGDIYTGSFLLIILPLIYFDAKGKMAKYVIPVTGIATLIILVLSVRRTSVVLVGIGLIFLMYFFRHQFSKIILNVFAMAIVLALTFPFYQDILLRQVQARTGEMTANLQEETRWIETVAVYRERIMNPDLKVLLFGQHLFDSNGNYDNGIHGTRPLHLDLNLMLHGAGLVGLILLVLFYAYIFYKYLTLKIRLDLPNEKLIHAAFLGIYFAHLFLLFSGGMLSVTFNIISMMYMGAILGLFRSKRQELKSLGVRENIKSNGFEKPVIPHPKKKPYIYEVNDKASKFF